MRRALPLKRRVALFGAALGLVLCGCFALGAWYIAEDYEHLLVAGVLGAEAEGVRVARANGLPMQLPATAQLRGWAIEPGAALPDGLPEAWARLPPGIHERPNAETEGLHLAVFEQQDLRLIYAMDLGAVEALERYLIGLSLLILLLGGAVSAVLAQWLAGRALKPLERVSQAVEALPVQPQPTALADGLAADSLGRLAAAIDHYQQRLLDAARAEREFFADASHELRSPVASLRGAAEVLLDDPDTPERLRLRLQRIDRASDELGQLIDALLLTARGDPPGNEPVDPQQVLAEACARMQERARARGVSMQLLEPTDDGHWPLPAPWLRTALLNLLRILIDLPGNHTLTLQRLGDTLEFRFQGHAGDAAERSDLGFPLRLVERLCGRMGLSLELAPLQLRLVRKS